VSGPLEAALLLSAPLLLAASGELVLERSGSIQVGLEGTMLLGAFAAFAVGLGTSSPGAALVAGAAAGLASGLLFALFAVVLRADPILVGTAWTLLGTGGSAFGYRLLAGTTGRSMQLTPLPTVAFGLPLAGIAAFALPPALFAFFRYTRAGLLVSACGERPEAVRALGRSVVGIRSAASAFAGAAGGAAGALLVLNVTRTFVEGVTAGRGFLALAVVVFARWRPLAVVPAALLVGGASALQYQLQAAGRSPLPYAFFLALPPLLALAAVALTSSRGGAPAALGRPAP
jgi:simple sugar transport system permease protein